MLALYANTGKEMLSLFIDGSIDIVLLQTNPDYQLLLDSANIPKLHLVDTLLQDSQTL